MANAANTGESSIKRAVIINMASRYSAALIQLAYSIVLARILSPKDFGLVAMAQVFVTFFALFQDMGLGSAIVQRQDLDDADISRLFGFSALLGVVLGVVFWMIGFPVSYVYGQPILRRICAALALTVLFSTLNTVPNALLMKQRRFVTMGVRQVVCALVSTALGLFSAKVGAGPFAIVVYSIVNALSNFIWNWLTNRIAPAVRGSLASIRKVFSYSSWLFGFNLINYFSRNADNLLIGLYFGAVPLGNYSKAYQLMQYPQTYLTNVVTSVLHPMLAEQQDDIDSVYDVFVKTTKALSLVGVFITVLCWFCADEIVLILYGEGWASSATCLRFLSVSVWSQMICGTSGAMFQVLNRTKEQFVRGILIMLAIITAIMVGVRMGSVEAVSALVGVAYFVAFVLMLPFLVRRSFGKSQLSYLKLFAPDIMMAAILSLVMGVLDARLHMGILFRFLIKLLVCGVAYTLLLAAFGQMRWLAMALPNALRTKIPKLGRPDGH